MKHVTRWMRFVILMSMTVPLFAGGMWFETGNPKAVADPAAKDAFATLRVFIIDGTTLVDPVLTGTAEGLVNHQRVSIPLTFTKLKSEGLYGIGWDRPKEGAWVLALHLDEWGLQGSSKRFWGSIGPDVFVVGDDGLKPQTKLMLPYRGGVTPGAVDAALRMLEVDRTASAALEHAPDESQAKGLLSQLVRK